MYKDKFFFVFDCLLKEYLFILFIFIVVYEKYIELVGFELVKFKL